MNDGTPEPPILPSVGFCRTGWARCGGHSLMSARSAFKLPGRCLYLSARTYFSGCVMPRCRKDSDDLPLILFFFLSIPWYVGPILSVMAYVTLRWIPPLFFPLPTSDPKKPSDAGYYVLAAFASMGTAAAPVVAIILLAAWAIAEIMKMAQRLSLSGTARQSSVSNNRLTKPNSVQSPATSVPNSTRTADRRVPLRDPGRADSQAAVTRERSKPNPPGMPPTAGGGEIDISEMKWKEFEVLLVRVLRHFGFRVEHTGRSGPDGGIDVRCIDSAGDTIIVQCKHWRTKEVGVTTVREFFGILIHERAARGLIVTSGLFTQEAKKFAQGKPISLVDGEKLLNLLSRAPGDTATNRYRISHLEWLISGEVCPLCSGRMIRRNGKFGEFLSCEQYPDCNGTKKV